MTPDLIRSEMISFSNSESIMLASTGPSADPIETPSICPKSWLLNENAVLVQESRISFFKVRFKRVVATSFSSKTRSRMILIVLVSGTFVNSETTSKQGDSPLRIASL